MSAQAGSTEWHAERRLGIGGSDCAAALGLSKFKTPYQLYLEKIGQTEPEDESWEMLRGKAMEPALCQHYANETGREVMLMKQAIVSDEYPFMRYNPDGMTPGRLQEFKTAAFGREWGEVGTDEIPQEYLLQVQHGMIVTNRPVADVTVSIAGNKPKFFVVESDKQLQEIIIEQEYCFWQKVKDKIAPDPISNEDVAHRYNKVNGKSIIADAIAYDSVITLRQLKVEIKSQEELKESLEVLIKNFMGENEILVDENMVPLCTWKQAKGAERLDTKAVKENEPDVFERYLKIGDPTRRFLVK